MNEADLFQWRTIQDINSVIENIWSIPWIIPVILTVGIFSNHWNKQDNKSNVHRICFPFSSYFLEQNN